ncbi:MAG: DnaJ domain-containing protein [Nitrospirae bacterium]|nr:DnaJ domain-containing protein [Nitrospirota bacterium]
MKDIINKRSFPRRKLDLEFDLIITGQAFPAFVTDFSLTGMGILIKGKSDIDSQILDLKIRDINLNAMGKIIWKREMFSGLKVGVTRMGPLEGTLGSYQRSDLLVGIRRARKTGVLHIETEQSLRKIYFKDGEMVFSSSDQEQEQLGAVLLASDKISLRQYQNTLSLAQETGKSQGTVMVEMRYISPQELVQAVHQRVESIIMNLCNVEDAKFFFREEALPRGEIVMLKLNANDLLYRGSRKAEHIDSFKNRFLHHHTKVFISSETRGILDRLVLEAQDREILSLINGKTSLNEILSMSPLKEEDTLRSVHALFNAQLLEVEAEWAEEEKPQEQETAADGNALDPELSERIDKLYRGHKTLGYQGILGLLPGATSAEIKSAYHAMAKEYHPDRYLFIRSEELREKLNVIFAYISEAYRELSRSGSLNLQQPQASASAAQPESQRMNNKTMAQDKYRQGRDSLGTQDYENAMTFFGQAVYLDESVPDYHYYYGIALLRNKKIKEAEASIRRALHLSPYNADYFAELGHIYLKLGFMTRAKNTFDKALRINPSQAHAADGMRAILELQKD